MEALFLGCLIGGVLFAIVTVLLGDVLSSALDGMLDFLSVDFFNPTIVAGAVTVFGGTGVLLVRYSGFTATLIVILSILTAVLISVVIYFIYVKPMGNSENSTGYSIQEMVGRIGEITIPVPIQGFGEVMVKVGAGNTLHIASSLEQISLLAGTRVVVVDVEDGVLWVTEFEERRGEMV
ncbi:NfeD family protein [Paenibacillus sp. IHBB 10380]|uniref:NfeD family protein n=1 Tax=Paenibacillus sp. IHBB 10380 TaxID=1566358 RepID=UPI0005CFD2F0|nr:NfeD family protein [Paenibacillus sp. IHBB 10380]AJS57580.1 membrane protease regulatory membrane protein [Paenibacillus sp. IHBB 10380]